MEVKCVAEFLQKIKNETKNITIQRYNIKGELNKITQPSKGTIKIIRISELKIIIKGRIFESKIDQNSKCENTPILW